MCAGVRSLFQKGAGGCEPAALAKGEQPLFWDFALALG